MIDIREYSHRLLRWSEKYTKTDMLYLAKGGFWAILSQIVSSGATFGLAIAFAHFVSKDAYGQYKYVLSMASILATLTLSGIGTAVLQSVASGFEGTMHYAFWKNIRWSALYFLIALGVSIYYFAHENNFLGISFLIAGSLAPIIASTNLYNAYLVAKKDFRRSAIYYNIIGNLIPALAIFATMTLTQNPIWFVAVYFFSNTLIGIILYIRIKKLYSPNDAIDDKALAYGKHLSFIGILAGLADNLDQILVFHYIGGAQLAIYNFAVAIPSQIKGPMKGLAGLMFPKFAERTDKEIRAGMSNKILLLFIGALVAIICYFFAAPYIFGFFFPKYMESVLYSQIFALSLLWIIAIPADAYLVVKKKIKEQYIVNIVGSMLQIAVLLFGILWAGLLGLIIARVIIQLFWSILSIFLYEKASKNAIVHSTVE